MALQARGKWVYLLRVELERDVFADAGTCGRWKASPGAHGVVQLPQNTGILRCAQDDGCLKLDDGSLELDDGFES